MSRIKPILFNSEMVRAILDGRKTVTRRVVKYKYSNTEMKMRTDKYGTRIIEIQKDVEGETFGKNPDGSTWRKLLGYIEPKAPYQPGDILYVRETFFYESHMEDVTEGEPDLPSGRYSHRYIYKADNPDYPVNIGVGATGWRPSIHMPKEAARLFLRVTDVRVERLQDITEEHAEKEGIRGYSKDGKLYKYAVTDDWWIDFHNKHKKAFASSWWQDMPRTAKGAFSYLWDSTLKESNLGRYGWDANPWVWVIEFEQIEKPEGWCENER